MQLYEKYRPKRLSEFIGQDKVKKQVSALIARSGFDRDAFFLSGPSGTGKTSLAWIIANELGALDFDIQEFNGEDINKGSMDDIRANIWLMPAGPWKVYIVNEAHNMTPRAIQCWLTLLEQLPSRRLIIFTTTESLEADLFGNFSSPFARRCKVLQFTNQGLCQLFAAKAQEIASKEGLNGKPIAAYVKLVQACKNNMGMVLQRIESGDML